MSAKKFLGKIERQRKYACEPSSQRLHCLPVGGDRRAKGGGALWPQIGMKVDRPIADGPVGAIARIERTDRKAFLQVRRYAARKRVAQALIGKAVVAATHSGGRTTDLHLLLARKREEGAAFAIYSANQRIIHAVAHNAEEPDVLACPRDRFDDSVPAAPSGGKWRDVDHRHIGIACCCALPIGYEFIARHGDLFTLRIGANRANAPYCGDFFLLLLCWKIQVVTSKRIVVSRYRTMSFHGHAM